MSDNENDWGNKKQQYYAMNKRDEEDSDYIEEEKEAIRLQKKRLNKLKALNLLQESDEESEEEKEGDSKDQKAKREHIKTISSSKVELIEISPEQIIEELQTVQELIEENEEELKDTIDILIDEQLSIPSTIEYLKWKKDLNIINALLLAFSSHLKLNDKMSNHHPLIKKIETIKYIISSTKKLNDIVNTNVDKLFELINTNKVKGKHQSKDEDEDENEGKDELNKMLNKKKQRNDDDEDDVDEDDEFIKGNITNIAKLKQQQLDKAAKEKKKIAQEVEAKNQFGIRKANKEVLKARGIYRKRKEYLGNAKLVNREKYYKKEKQRKSLVKQYEGKPDVYGGEATGIRRDLVRSTLIKS